MKRLDVQGFKDLANQLRFSLSDAEAQDIKNEFDVLIDQMDLLNKIDTEGIEPIAHSIGVLHSKASLMLFQ